MYKICSSCDQEKLSSQFRKDKTQKDGFQPRCKLCARAAINANYKKYRTKTLARNKARQEKSRQFVQERRESSCCEFCPEDDPVCLDFHHRDPTTKSFSLSRVTTQSKKTILKEISKCIVACSNCHRKIHAGKIQVS